MHLAEFNLNLHFIETMQFSSLYWTLNIFSFRKCLQDIITLSTYRACHPRLIDIIKHNAVSINII